MKESKSIIKHCRFCFGEDSSSCCEAEINYITNKCFQCGRFCTPQTCEECGGSGSIQIDLKDEVTIFICQSSPKYLKEQFPKFNKSKFLKGIVKEFIDSRTLKVKLSTRTITVDVDDIEFD